jgi:hypothetical protein
MFFSESDAVRWDSPPWEWKRPGVRLGVYAVLVGQRGIYIGSGVIIERWRDHWKQLRAGNHNTLFQRAVNLVGPRGIQFDVLQHAPDRTPHVVLEDREYQIMESFLADGWWEILNVLLPPTEPDKRFRIGPGGKWKQLKGR